MILEKRCIEMILKKFPEFRASKEWQKHLDFWDNKPAGLCNEMSTFSIFVERLLNEGDEVCLRNIFNFAEHLMLSGDQAVRDAIATCFLENLINYTSHGNLDPKSFVHFLGEESREYCKAWDEFTGVKTEGLWDDQ